MTKSPDAFRTISEVADWLGIQAHVLRFWESKFTQVKPIKRAGGRRYYRPVDMLLLGGIKKLLHEDGLTIKGVQKILREEGMGHVADMSAPLDELTLSQLDDVIDATPVNPTLAPSAPVHEEKGVILSFEAPTTDNSAPETPVTENPEPPQMETDSKLTIESDALPLLKDAMEDTAEATETPDVSQEQMSQIETVTAAEEKAPQAEALDAAGEDAPEAEALDPAEDGAPEAETEIAAEEEAPLAETADATEQKAPEAETPEAAEEETPEAETVTATDEETDSPEDGTDTVAAQTGETPDSEEHVARSESHVSNSIDVEESGDAVAEQQDDVEAEPESEDLLPEFIRRPMAEPVAPVDEPQFGFDQPDINSNNVETDLIAESAPPAPLPRNIDMPLTTPEADIMANPGTLSAVYRLRRLGPEQAADIAPLLPRLTSLRDSMASRRLRDSTFLRRQAGTSPEANE